MGLVENLGLTPGHLTVGRFVGWRGNCERFLVHPEITVGVGETAIGLTVD